VSRESSCPAYNPESMQGEGRERGPFGPLAAGQFQEVEPANAQAVPVAKHASPGTTVLPSRTP
jgi:hypothetical protein